jgi:xylulose-5-phosphate/fructose-6-phosphate phosphoketolase
MFNQPHAKWLKVARESLEAADRLAQLSLTSHVWRQDRSGLSHQDQVYRPRRQQEGRRDPRLPAARRNTLPRSPPIAFGAAIVNVIIAGAARLQWLRWRTPFATARRMSGLKWASNDRGSGPTSSLACGHDDANLETLLRRSIPAQSARTEDPCRQRRRPDDLQPRWEAPRALERPVRAIFTTDKPVIFAYHGYPWLIHRLTYRRRNHGNLHVRGYKEEGTTTTPFDMVVRNDLDRFHLAGDVVDRVKKLGPAAGYIQQEIRDILIAHREHIVERGEDLPEIRNWKWEG